MMMSHKELCQLLRQEVQLVEALNAVLLQEQAALTHRQFEQLAKYSEKKQELSEKLEASAQMRVSLCSATNDPQSYKQGLSLLLKQCTDAQAQEIHLLNEQLAQKLLDCRSYNQVNGQVISANLNSRQEILHALTNQAPAPKYKTYTEGGQIKQNPYSGRHEKA